MYLCIPTGGGKTMIILHNHINNISERLLVLVPRIVLMEQWGEECTKLGIKPYLIGTGQHCNMEKIKDETIVICVYDSFPNIYEHKDKFQRYCIDEAHNIKIPERYMDTEIDNDIEIDDDIDEEQLSYMECIQSLSDSKRVIYISATLDQPKDGSLFYEYKLRQAINEGYLCDYQFVFPIFEQENVSNDHLALYLLHKEHASHCVIYASSCKEGKEFTQILNKLQKGCAGYIDAHTPYKKRKQLFADFESGKIQFLINIRVLTEGFNAPHIRSIFFLRISTSDIFIIQVIGRALRLHQDKSIATIYFPFTQESDLERIQTFLHQLSTYDERINQTISEKKIGGYISIEHGDIKDNDAEEDDEDDEDENIEDVFTFKYNLIVNSMGKCDKIEEMMKKKADELMKFVNDKGRIPTQKEEFGKFWHNTKNRKGRYLEIYQTILSKNSILSADYEKTQKIREDKKDKLSFEDQAKMLFNTTHVPKQDEVIYVRGYPFQIGRYWTRILQGQSPYLYKTIISQNPILSVAYEEAKRRRVISTKDKANEVIKFVNDEKRVPKYNEVIYVKGFKFKIGKFWVSIKFGQNHVIYKTILSTNLILSADYDKTQKNKEEKKIEPKYDILDYSKMNVKELKQLCKDRKITKYSRKSKEELINMLKLSEKIEPDSKLNYNKTVKELRKLCKDRNITGYSQKSKEELINMLSV